MIEDEEKKELLDSAERAREKTKMQDYLQHSLNEKLWKTIDKGCEDPNIRGNFYIRITGIEQLYSENVIHQLFFYCQSCPIPDYNQTVYRYVRNGGEIEVLWSIPSKFSCKLFPEMKGLPDYCKLVVDMIQDFKNGDFYKTAVRYNKEKFSSQEESILGIQSYEVLAEEKHVFGNKDDKTLSLAVDRGRMDPDIDTRHNFYIVAPFLEDQNVVISLFSYHQSCPAATYNQSVYYYIRNSSELQLLWHIPSKSQCKLLSEMKDLSDSCKMTLSTVQLFKNGDLDRVASRYDEEFLEI